MKGHDSALWDLRWNGLDQDVITDSLQCILCPLQFIREKKIHAHLEDIVITDICGNPIF